MIQLSKKHRMCLFLTFHIDIYLKGLRKNRAMNREQYEKRKKLRRRKRLKRRIIAYLLRAIVILIPIIVIRLVVCGCSFLYGRFAKEDGKTDIYAEDGAAPVITAGDALLGFCVVIDAGHGGSDGGTVSGEIAEKDINLSTALKLKAILEDSSIEVIMTRNSDEDMSLDQRVSVANNSDADFFVSLHCNFYEGDARIAGLECYYSSPEAEKSKAYAESIINAVSQSDDIITRNAKTESYYVLQNTQMPAVLVEMGFLSNYSESQKLSDDEYQEVLSEKIAEGIYNEIKGEKISAAYQHK